MTDQTSAVVPEMTEREAVMRAFGFDKLSPAMQLVAMKIAEKYSLEPLLQHVVIVDGKPFITRNGLLRVAHKSGVFDGIEVSEPEVVEMPVGDKGATRRYWVCKATVYRKDMNRPFTYPGRYPLDGQNARYGVEMAVKVAESMALRRAFDVAAPVVEERWESDGTEVTVEEPKSLADKIAARADAIESSMAQEDPGGVAPVGIGKILAEMEEAGDIKLVTSAGGDEIAEPIEGREAPPEVAAEVEAKVATAAELDPDLYGDEPSAGEGATEAPVQVPLSPDAPPDAAAQIASQPTSDEGPTLAEFADLTSALERSLVQATAKRLFPDKKGFKELTPAELGQVLDELATVDVDEAIDDEAGMGDVARQIDAAAPVGLPDQEAPKPPSGIKLCGNDSPYGDGKTCTMDAGHGGPHRAGVSSSW